MSSRKMGEAFEAESQGEAETTVLADTMERVVAFRPQVAEVLYRHDGRVRHAFPDLGVRMLNGAVELWEVKSEACVPGLVERLADLSSALAACGVRYRVRTSHWRRRGAWLANARLLRRFADWPVRASVRADVAAVIASGPGRDVGDLQLELGLQLQEVFAAAARGWLAVDLGDRPLGERSAVRAAKDGARSGGYSADDDLEGAGR